MKEPPHLSKAQIWDGTSIILKPTVARKGHVFSVQIYRFSVEMQFLRANPNVLRTKSLAPCKPDRSPYKYEASPYKYEASPYKYEASPYKYEASPYKREASPYKREASPYKCEASPYKYEASPYKYTRMANLPPVQQRTTTSRGSGREENLCWL